MSNINMSNIKAIAILDDMIGRRRYDLDIYWGEDNEYCARVSCALIAIQEAKARIEALPDEWISADNQPEKIQMKQLLAYEIDERRRIITATFYDGNWLRDDNKNICFFDFWQPLPNPPIPKK